MALAGELKRLFLFESWPDSALSVLADHSRRTVYERDEIIFHRGQRCLWLQVLLSGKVRIFRSDESGRITTLQAIGPGGLVGCAALFLDAAYPASAMAQERSVILAVDGREFTRMIESRPDLNRRFIGALASRLNALAGTLESRASERVPDRLGRWLLSRSAGGNAFELGSTKRALAEELGTTPETLSRALAFFRSKQWIRVRGRIIELSSPEGLREWILQRG